MEARNNWNREQTIVALYAYCIVPFNKATNSNPDIIRIAPLIGRSIVALKMKIGNFGSLDPNLANRGISGLGNCSNLDEEIWNEYYGHWDVLIQDAMKILSSASGSSLYELVLPQGEDIVCETRVRLNQNFFRTMILSAYDDECCISGVNKRELVQACHILSWASHEDLRTNPTNGLCLNPFFHSAYDNNLVSVDADYNIHVSDSIISSTKDTRFRKYLESLRGRQITMPTKFLPNREYLAQRHQEYLSANF